jgi:photosystem II stability/assembly factor-like uncharacterized protein
MRRRRRFLTPLLIINLALIVLALSSFFAASGVSSSTNSWTRSGPVIGIVDSLAVSPSNPSIVYAGVTSRSGGFGPTSTTGIYKSTDGGSNWSRSGLVGKTLFSLAVDPTDSNKVYAGTRSNGLYKSTDGGANWSGPFIDSTVDVFSLAVDPSQPSVLYCSPTNRGFLKSTDSGVTWNSINKGINYFVLNAIAIDPTNTNIVYVSGGHGSLGGIYKSTDAGANWVVSSTGIPDSFNDVRAVALSPSNNSILYAASGSDVYKSTDAAASWTKQSDGLSNSLITDLAIDPSNPSVVFAATIGKGIFKTVDAGMNWTSAGLNTIGVNTLNFEGTTSLNLYAGTRGSGVVKTTDGGLNWQQSSNAPYGDVREILIDPNNPAIIYANNSDTLSKSTNHGADWSATNLLNQVSLLPGFPTHKLIIDPTNSSTLYLGVDFSGVFKTTDGGVTWNRVFSANTNIEALAIDPSNPSNIYLATYPVNLFKSIDGGVTWPPIPAPGDVSVLSVDPTNPSIVYAGTNIGVFKSTNAGASWSLTSLTNPSFSNPYIISLVIDSTNPSVLYAATFNGGAFKTINGGSNWNPVFSEVAGHVLSFAIDKNTPTTVFAGTEQGVYQSTNGGQTSNALTVGWPSPAQPAMALAFDATARNLYAGTSDGLYICQISATPTPTPTPTPTHTISGRVAAGGFGLSNVIVALSGTVSATQQTDANGHYSFTNLAQGGSYTITPSKTNYVFSPQSLTFSSLGGNQTADFAASVAPGVPILISEETSTRALALNSAFWTREPFQLNSLLSSEADKRTRVTLFATNFDLMTGESASVVTADAEDVSHRIYPLTVESVGTIPELNWLRFVVVRLHDEVGDIGDVLVRISVHGMSSNRVRMGIGHTGGGPPDDPGAVPTPGRPPGKETL